MKEKQNKRRGLKLISLLGAFLVWLWVVSVADPVMTDTVEIPVEIVNGNILTDNGLTYEIVGKKTTTVSYEVHSTNAYRIHASDFRAYIDLAELWSVTGAVPVKVEVLSNAGYLVSSPVRKTTAIKIETEPLQTKRFEFWKMVIRWERSNFHRIISTFRDRSLRSDRSAVPVSNSPLTAWIPKWQELQFSVSMMRTVNRLT